MPSLKKGEILEVVSDCPQSINNIPQDARNYGAGYSTRRANHPLSDPEVIPPVQAGDALPPPA
jgi:hypothetical protein